jgi:hypothetical protein
VRLLQADRLAGVAQELGMINVDAGHDRAVGVDEVDRIEPPAQPDLQDQDIERER